MYICLQTNRQTHTDRRTDKYINMYARLRPIYLSFRLSPGRKGPCTDQHPSWGAPLFGVLEVRKASATSPKLRL